MNRIMFVRMMLFLISSLLLLSVTLTYLYTCILDTRNELRGDAKISNECVKPT